MLLMPLFIVRFLNGSIDGCFFEVKNKLNLCAQKEITKAEEIS